MHDLQVDVVETESPSKTSSRRRRLRFSLRSLLIVCTLFSLLLGVFMHRVRTQKQAVAEICKLYGRVAYKTNWLGHMLPESVKNHLDKNFCENVVSVSLSWKTVYRRRVTPTDAELEQIVDAIARLPHATKLRIQKLCLQDNDLARLALLRHKIEELTINEFYPGDLKGNQLEGLGRWTQLRSLTLQLGNLNETFDLQSLASLPNLTYLSIGQDTLDENVFLAISKMDSLQTLSLSDCCFSGEHLRHLQQLPKLSQLTLHNIYAETKYESYTMDQAGDCQPLGKPVVLFGSSPDISAPSSCGPPAAPMDADEQQQWLNGFLPNVRLFHACNTSRFSMLPAIAPENK